MKYETEPYRTELDVRVEALAEDDEGRRYALLDDTILYPEGGGQPADRGWIDGAAVVDVQRVGDEVRHVLAAGHDAEMLTTGTARLRLDWQRRYDHMQQHTAQHVLTAVAADRFGWPTTSFHLGAERSDIELAAEGLGLEDLVELEDAAMAEVRAARPVRARRVSADELAALDVRTRGLPKDHRGDVRLIEIEGLDLNTCGGTHLASTAEIEAVKLLDTEAMRGGTRLYWIAGRRVRRRLDEHERRSAELRRLLETSNDELVEMIRTRLDRLGRTERRVRDLEGEIAELAAEGLAARQRAVVDAHFEDVDGGFLQRLARRLGELEPRQVALFTASGAKGELFVVLAAEEAPIDAAVVGPSVAELLEGRGGGAGGIFQGRAGSLARRAEAVEALRSSVDSGRS